MVLGSYVDEDSQLGEWRKERPLGRGGFGAIALWRNMVTGEPIAIKSCTRSASEMSTINHKRWAQEVEILQKLDHPNVVKGLPIPKEFLGLNSSLPFMAMEYCSGGDLRKVLLRPENCRGLKEKEVRRLLKDIASALEYLHKHRIIHRDLKPENVVLQNQAGEVVYKLIDLGYAKELDQSSLCSSFVGTLQYLAPELFERKPYTSSVDYWSLGILAYEVASGRRPFSPNEGPPVWVPLVNQKGCTHISGYVGDDGVPVYSSSLPQSTHLTRIFKAELETWLQVLLQIDPQKRGRKNGLSAYDLLENVLSQQVAHIFDATSLSTITVPRSCAPAIDDLSQVISHATGVSPSNSLLLMDKAIAVVPEDIWGTCKDPMDPAITLYHFDLSVKETKCTGYRPECLLSISDEVSRCENDQLVRDEMKRLWAEGIFCVQQEVAKCQRLLCAYQALLGHLKAQNNALQEEVIQVIMEMTALSAKTKFAHECFTMDVESLQKLGHARSLSEMETMIKDWSYCDYLLTPVDNENRAVKAVQNRASKLAAQVTDYEKTPFALSKQPIVLKDKLNDILEQYRDAKRKLRETQCFAPLCHNLQSGLMDFKEEEERLVEECLNYIRHMCALLKGMQSLKPELAALVQDIHKLSWKVSSQQRKRQETVWNLHLRKPKVSGTPQRKNITRMLQHSSVETEGSSTSLQNDVERCLSESGKAVQDSEAILLKMESALNEMTSGSLFHTSDVK